jgi:hypothetical protein
MTRGPGYPACMQGSVFVLVRARQGKSAIAAAGRCRTWRCDLSAPPGGQRELPWQACTAPASYSRTGPNSTRRHLPRGRERPRARPRPAPAPATKRTMSADVQAGEIPPIRYGPFIGPNGPGACLPGDFLPAPWLGELPVLVLTHGRLAPVRTGWREVVQRHRHGATNAESWLATRSAQSASPALTPKPWARAACGRWRISRRFSPFLEQSRLVPPGTDGVPTSREPSTGTVYTVGGVPSKACCAIPACAEWGDALVSLAPGLPGPRAGSGTERR